MAIRSKAGDRVGLRYSKMLNDPYDAGEHALAAFAGDESAAG